MNGDDEGYLLTRIVIEFVDGDGKMPTLVEILGILTMNGDDAIKTATGDIPED